MHALQYPFEEVINFSISSNVSNIFILLWIKARKSLSLYNRPSLYNLKKRFIYYSFDKRKFERKEEYSVCLWVIKLSAA